MGTGRSEREVRMILESIFVAHKFPRCRPSFLEGLRGRCLELDGYCVSLHLAFEYNGEHHYDSSTYFNRVSGQYADIIMRDRMKLLLCNALGIRVIVVPYWVRDRWNFVRCCLLQWFRISDIYLALLSA